MILVAGFVAFIVLDSWLGVAALALGALIEVGELYFWIQFLKRYRVQTGPEGLIGERGVVTIACPPGGIGQVRAHGELWRAHCPAGAELGAEVAVTAVAGLLLTVEPTGRRG